MYQFISVVIIHPACIAVTNTLDVKIDQIHINIIKSDISDMSAELPKESKLPEQKRKCKISFASNLFSEYCSHTSIHGIGYLGANDKSILEKVWWFTMFVLSVATCSILINNTWQKWQNTPVIMSFSHTQTPIWEIPFPAVTICPVNKVQQLAYNYTEAYLNRKKLEGKEHKEFWDISLICNLQYTFEFDLNRTTDEEAISSILKVAPTLTDTVYELRWQGDTEIFTQKLFTPQLTAEGLCFTFNSLIGKDMYTDQVNSNIILQGHGKENEGWTMEKGYPVNLDMKTYPIRTAQDGLLSGISILLMSYALDKDYVCGDFISGYKILLHNPAELPRVKHQYILAPLNRQLTVSVKPDMVTTSKGLLHIPPRTRECYFSDEKILRFYKTYTQVNCQTECLANVTKRFCNCLPFYSPRDNETNICGYGSIICLKLAQDEMLKYEISKKKSTGNKNNFKSITYEMYEECNCLPSCTSLSYTSETSQTNLHWRVSLDRAGVILNLGKFMQATRVDIFFRESYFMALHRSEMYGLTDFIANCGGLLGLFMGFSFLSLLEIVYFVTLRLWCRLRNKDEIYDTNT